MKNLFLGLMISAFTVPAFAETNTSVELLLGSAKQTTKADGDSSSGDDTSFGLRGAMAFHPNVAVELSYQNFGQSDDTYIDSWGDTINQKTTTSTVALGLKGILPINNQISLNARVGVAHWDLEADVTDSSLGFFNVEETGTDIYYGIGTQFNIHKQLYLGAEYTITPMHMSVGGINVDHEVKNLAVYIGYSF